MFEKTMKKKTNSLKENYQKEENTLDYYISKNLSAFKSESAINEDAESGDRIREDYSRKHEFLKKNISPADIIPEQMQKDRYIRDNMGYFETPFGTVSVGYKKYKTNSDIGFSVVPKEVKESDNIPERQLPDSDTYFGGASQGRFGVSKLSFKYSPHTGVVTKLKDDRDGVPDEETKLLYQDKKEDEQIEDLKEIRNDKNVSHKSVDKEIAKIRDIKKEKEEDNLVFLKEINNFIDIMKKNKLKKIADSDDIITRRKRIIELSGNFDLSAMDIIELKKLLEKILKRKEFSKLPDISSKIKEKELTKEQLAEIILKLQKELPGE